VNDRKTDVGAFGGIAGRVLEEALSGSAILTGGTLVLVMGLGGFILHRLGSQGADVVFGQMVLSLVLVRFALNGRFGEWGGTLFSDHGGPWIEVAAVTGRYLALTAVWFVPLYLLGWRLNGIGEAAAGAMMGMGGSRLLGLTLLAAAATTLTPPVFLIAAVGADNFAQTFLPAHWRRLFEGRLHDLFLIYAVYLGTLGMVAVLAVPPLLAIGIHYPHPAIMLGLGILAFTVGLSASLLGRLCGFFSTFAGGRDELADAREDAAPVPPAPVSAASEAPATDLPEDVPELGTESTQLPADVPEEAEAPENAPDPDSPGLPPQPADLQLIEGGKAHTPSGKGPLLDARKRVEELNARFRSDPADALEALEELRENYAPNPLVLHAVTLLRQRAGDKDGSFDVASEALTLCLERGAIKLAAEIYATHIYRAEEFELPRDRVLEIADELRRDRMLAAAETAYLRILDRDPEERRAVKGLLQVADGYLHHAPNFPDAHRVYSLLLQRCPDSPLALFMREGLAEAERRMHQAS
jgi:hypothetical protein